MDRVAQLPFVGVYYWTSVLQFLQDRAMDGVELVESGVYRRTVRYEGAAGTLQVAHDDAVDRLVVTLRGFPDDRSAAVLKNVRRMFDLDADMQAIASHLSSDPAMAPLVASRPALRVFRGPDPFEVAMRSIIGQQVTVARARRLNSILVERAGGALASGLDDRLTRVFPTPEQVRDANLTDMGMPGARVATLKTVAIAALSDPALFERHSTVEETVARLRSLPGIGDWTAHYIAMRACGEPDAFPSSDIGLLRGAADAGGRRPTAAQLLARAEAWRPWRAYAAHHLWANDTALRPSGRADLGPDSTARDGVRSAAGGGIVDRAQGSRRRRR